jgi:cytochrome d ubiquinol oxidase subunit I
MKLAAIEGMWETEKAPAPFTIVGLPDQAAQTNAAEVKVPWALGLIATRSISTELPGIKDLVKKAEARIRNGVLAYDALERFKANRNDVAARAELTAKVGDLGYALLLKRHVADPRTADDATIAKAALDTVPKVAPLFWSFRLMVALGFYFIALFAYAFWRSTKRDFSGRGFLKLCVVSLPLPWLASELGWFVAEYGRQPWAIDGILPTGLAASALSVPQVLFTLGGFVVFYSSLLIVDVVLMRKYVVMGPVKALALDTDPAAPNAAPAH